MKSLLTGLLLTAVALPAFATELTIWDWKSGDPAAAAYFQKAKEVFESAHPGDTITYVMQPNDQYYTLLGTALASDGGPDLFLLNGGAQARARFENSVNLDGKLGDLQGNLAGLAEFSDANGIYAVPLTIQGFVVYYNKKLYADAGLNPAKPPKSWADLTQVCAAIIHKADVPCIALGNKEGYGMEFWFSSIAASLWTPQEQADFAAGKLAWTSPQVLAVLQSWVDANAAGWFPKGANSTAKFMDEYEGFMRGESANTIGLISDVAHWKSFDEMLGADDVGAFLMPAPGGTAPKIPASGGIGYAVNKKSPNADLAVAFEQVLAQPDVLQVFFDSAGAVTANTKMDVSAVTSPSAKLIFGWLATDVAPTAHANASAAQLEELHRQSQMLLNGETTVADAAAALDKVGK
ncbi:MAG: extracellular solute-binding protein [Pseudorhodobacter sp.]|nr:extracellular solute-binding protein [Pseudorhodobacter sp.]